MFSLHYYIPCTQQWSWFWLLVGLFEGRIFMFLPSCPAPGTHRLSCLHIAPPPDRSPGQPEQMQLKQAAQPTEMYTWCMTSMTSSKKLDISGWKKMLCAICISFAPPDQSLCQSEQMQLKQAAGQASLEPDKNAGIMLAGNKLIVVSSYIVLIQW